MSAPDIASAAPIIMPRTSRGSRIWMTTSESCVGSTPRPSIAWTRNLRDASARNRDSAMRERKQRDEGQKRDERGGSQKDPAAAVGLEADLAADLVDRDAHCRSARVGSGGNVKLG